MKKCLMLICIVGLLVLAAATTASAKVVRWPISGTETLVCDPFNPGDTICAPGEWTSPGGKMHFRGMVELLQVESDSDDLRVVGYSTIVANGNLDALGYGPVWGTYHMEVDDKDGYWEGTWAGKIDESGMATKMRARGYGDLAGLLIQGDYFRLAGELLVGDTEGVIIELPTK